MFKDTTYFISFGVTIQYSILQKCYEIIKRKGLKCKEKRRQKLKVRIQKEETGKNLPAGGSVRWWLHLKPSGAVNKEKVEDKEY